MINLLEPRLVGRDALVTALGLIMERPDLNGAVVFGEMGMGKSALATHLLNRGSSTARSFLVQGAEGLSDVPYGALAPFLDDVGAGGLGSPLAVLRSVMTHFRRKSDGLQSLVIVDDAHLLDRETSHLLAQLVISGTIHFLGFARADAGYSEELASLIDDGVLARFDLAPLTPDDVAENCRHVLEAGIVRGASDYFAEESGGNPLFLRSIVLHALRSQCLVKSDDIYVLLYEPEEVDPSLRDLVSSSVRHLPGPQRDVLDSVALGGEVPFVMLSATAGDLAVRSLLSSGFIRASAKDQAIAVCNPPLYAKILRSLVPSGRSAELHARLLPPGTPLPPFGRARIRHLNWALDCDEHVDDDVLLEAAQVACAVFDPLAALRLAGAVRSEDNAVAAAVEAARAQFIMRRTLPEASSARALVDLAPDADSLAAAAVLTAKLDFAVTGRAESVADVAESWEQRLRQLDPDEEAEQTQQQALAVGVLRAFALNLSGGFSESEHLLRGVLAASLPLKETALAEAFLGEVLGATGRCVEGLGHLETALDLVRNDRFSLGEIRDAVVSRHISLLIHNGEFDGAQRAIDAYSDELRKDYFFSGGTLGVLQGLLNLRLGKFREAHDDLRHAIAALRLSDQDAIFPYALGLFAWTAAVLDLSELNERLLKEFELLAPRGSVVFYLSARAYAAAARDRLDPAGHHTAELSQLAEEARAHEFSVCEKDVLELLVLLGEDQHATRLAEVTADFEGPEAKILHDYATALVTEDPQLFIEAGDLAEERGKHFIAVDAVARALRLFTARGDQKSQRNVLRILRHRRGMLEYLVAPGAGTAHELKDLTARELKIASLAASGASNRDIAKQLTVSPRTVEGHLYRIYVKLGITKRDELASVVESRTNPRSSLVRGG
ncbi:helix-turn-helix transcriptional regulator [Arthrobacter sp. MDT3-44]